MREKTEIKTILEIVEKQNHPYKRWSFLTSIDYMLNSKLYVDDLYKDLEYVKKFVVDPECKMLDFGTGCGIFAILLSKTFKNVYAIDTVDNKSQTDPNFEDAAHKQKNIWNEFSRIFNVDFQHYDGLNIPFPDNYFDAITTYAVIEHILPEDLDKIINELRRILKPGGLLFVFKLPRNMAYIEHLSKLLGLGGHDILYGDKEVVDLFQRYDFKCLKGWRSVLFFEYPGWITNRISYHLKALERVLYFLPINYIAHHNNLILRNIKLKLEVKQEVKKEILIIAPTFLPMVGGSETHINDLINFLADRNFKVNLIACSYFDKNVLSRERRKNIYIKRICCLTPMMNKILSYSSLFYFIYIAPILFVHSFWFMLKNHKKVGIIHVHAFTAALSGAMLKPFFRNQKFVLSVHGIYFSKMPQHLRYNKFARYLRTISRSYDKILASGDRSRNELVNIRIDAAKIIKYRYWLNEQLFKPVNRSMDKDRLNVLFVGRLIKDKGVDTILDVATKMRYINFWFAGEGYLESEIKKRAEQYENIKLLGRLSQDKLPRYYSEADLTLIFSQNDGEGLPRVLIESLFCGTPVIATDCGGAREVVNPSVGFVIERDKQSLISCLNRYIGDKQLQQTLASNCVPFARANFSIKQADVILKCYQDLLHGLIWAAVRKK